jgi:hypothetical protein
MNAIPPLELTASRRFELSTWLRSELENMSPQAIDGVTGPAELSVMGIVPDVVFTQEAWPHTDPKWPTSVFYTMTVDGDMYEFGSLAHPDGMRAAVGKVFCVNPLELHWLRPDPVVSTGWVALQWVVPREQAGAFELAVAGAINAWNATAAKLPLLG